jgi:hypothetical protein
MIGTMDLSQKRHEKMQLDHRLKDSEDRVTKARERVQELEQKIAQAQKVHESLQGSEVQRVKADAQRLADHIVALQTDLADAKQRVQQVEAILKAARKAHESFDHAGLAAIEKAEKSLTAARRELHL